MITAYVKAQLAHHSNQNTLLVTKICICIISNKVAVDENISARMWVRALPLEDFRSMKGFMPCLSAIIIPNTLWASLD